MNPSRPNPRSSTSRSPKKPGSRRGATSRKRATSAEPLDLQDAPLAAMPTNVRPMLATLVHQPFDRRGWLFEIKWDGYRAIAEVDRVQVRLYSRNGLSFTKRYWPITAALQKLEHQAVLDGEVGVLDDKG